jgi:NADH-quinone oxidoreductase subunit N
VLQALIASGDSFYLGLAVFAVMMSLIGAFYYLRVIKVMYFDGASTTSPVAAPVGAQAVLFVNAGLVLVLGIFPGGLMTLCADAVRQMLGS